MFIIQATEQALSKKLLENRPLNKCCYIAKFVLTCWRKHLLKRRWRKVVGIRKDECNEENRSPQPRWLVDANKYFS